jgi:hypothetical protein
VAAVCQLLCDGSPTVGAVQLPHSAPHGTAPAARTWCASDWLPTADGAPLRPRQAAQRTNASCRRPPRAKHEPAEERHTAAPAAQDTMDAYDLLPKSATASWKLSGTFSTSVAVLCAAAVAALSAFVELRPLDDAHVQRYHMYFIHVAIMIFVGFGFLMTFLRRYSYSAVGLNFFASCQLAIGPIVMLMFVLVGGAVQQVG